MYKEIKCGDQICQNIGEMANIFNRYFVDSITLLREDDTEMEQRRTDKYTENVLEVFSKIECENLKRVVQKLENKSGTEEGITVEIMKCVVEVGGDKICFILNKLLEEGIFPSKWKEAIVVPVPKVRGTIKVEEFRPINKLPIYEKILELIVRKQLVDYLESNNLFQECQSGFRSSHSCQTALQWVISSWGKKYRGG